MAQVQQGGSPVTATTVYLVVEVTGTKMQFSYFDYFGM
jgi:hypothetical protein